MNENNDSSSFLNKFSYIASKVIATMASISKRVVTYFEKSYVMVDVIVYDRIYIIDHLLCIFIECIRCYVNPHVSLFFRHLFLFPEYCIKSPIKDNTGLNGKIILGSWIKYLMILGVPLMCFLLFIIHSKFRPTL